MTKRRKSNNPFGIKNFNPNNPLGIKNNNNSKKYTPLIGNSWGKTPSTQSKKQNPLFTLLGQGSTKSINTNHISSKKYSISLTNPLSPYLKSAFTKTNNSFERALNEIQKNNERDYKKINKELQINIQPLKKQEFKPIFTQKPITFNYTPMPRLATKPATKSLFKERIVEKHTPEPSRNNRARVSFTNENGHLEPVIHFPNGITIRPFEEERKRKEIAEQRKQDVRITSLEQQTKEISETQDQDSKKLDDIVQKLEQTLKQIQALRINNPNLFNGDILDSNNPLVQIYQKLMSELLSMLSEWVTLKADLIHLHKTNIDRAENRLNE